MRNGSKIAVVIPALNEERSIGKVVTDIPDWVDDIVVVDNGSTDRTVEAAAESGARVVHEPVSGYGSACLTGMAALNEPDVVAFLDGDYSDHPDEMHLLVDPILSGRYDMVIGSRTLGERQPGALTPQARFGNWLACSLIRLFWRIEYTDLGPFRAIRYDALSKLSMQDRDFGWTVEMQIKAILNGLKITEAPVSYRRRIGTSKISGTVRGVFLAGKKILGTIFKFAFKSSIFLSGPAYWQGIVLFTRYPEPGKTKTRLIPKLGPEKAARLQYLMTGHAIRNVEEFRNQSSAHFEIRYEGGNANLMKRAFGRSPTYKPQGQGNLGIRLLRAHAEALATGVEKVVIIGADCPDLDTGILGQAFQSLLQYDVTLGPAADGGYYLIGLRRFAPRLFADILWGTDKVLDTTIKRADEAGLSVGLLKRLSDIDRPEDLHIWESAARRRYGRSWNELEAESSLLPVATLQIDDDVVASSNNYVSSRSLISVIIPTLDEEARIPATLLRVCNIQNVEVIVADGGSHDRTAQYATEMGVRVITSSKGRSAQMNAGAEAASGEILLFLHADTLLPDDWAEHVSSVLAQPGTSAGAFEFRLDALLPGSRIIERLANLRSRRFHMPYGDQAIFMKADLFNQVGGFPSLPIMEDFELIRQLQKHGKVRTADVAAITSARRWREEGLLRTTLANQLVILAYTAGFSPSSIKRLRDTAKGDCS